MAQNKYRQSKWDIQDDSKEPNSGASIQLSHDATLSQSQNQRYYDGNQSIENISPKDNRTTPKNFVLPAMRLEIVLTRKIDAINHISVNRLCT